MGHIEVSLLRVAFASVLVIPIAPRFFKPYYHSPLHLLPSPRNADNQSTSASHPLSKETISQTVDKAMDRVVPSSGDVLPGVSIRNGPVQEIDTPMPDANGV